MDQLDFIRDIITDMNTFIASEHNYAKTSHETNIPLEISVNILNIAPISERCPDISLRGQTMDKETAEELMANMQSRGQVVQTIRINPYIEGSRHMVTAIHFNLDDFVKDDCYINIIVHGNGSAEIEIIREDLTTVYELIDQNSGTQSLAEDTAQPTDTNINPNGKRRSDSFGTGAKKKSKN